MAISGDYMSAASFLGISGAIALFGYDGFLYSIRFLVAWLIALLLVAELLRNSGRYTGVNPVTGASLSLFPAGVDFSWFPLENPGIISIPLGFFGWLGTVTSREPSSIERFTELEVRSFTGAGAEQAVQPFAGTLDAVGAARPKVAEATASEIRETS